MHRRSQLSAGAGVLVVLAVTCVLAGCGPTSASSSTSSSAAKPQTVRISLDYTANVDYLGIYTAIGKGYFARQGITPVIIPYTNTPAEPLIQSGKTDLGITYPPDVIINRSEGLRYKAVAALVSGNTTALAVLASSHYTRPSQLNGKLYGGFGIQSDKPIISAILKADGAASPSYKQVVLDTDVIDALSKRRVAYTAVFGGIDDVAAGLQGIKLRTFPYTKYLGAAGDYPNAVFAASDSEIAERGPTLRRALKALAEGYEYAAKNPAGAESFLIRNNEAALSHSQTIVEETGNATAPTFLDAAGVWGPLKGASFAALETILASGGLIRGTPPPASAFYTNALLPSSK